MSPDYAKVPQSEAEASDMEVGKGDDVSTSASQGSGCNICTGYSMHAWVFVKAIASILAVISIVLVIIWEGSLRSTAQIKQTSVPSSSPGQSDETSDNKGVDDYRDSVSNRTSPSILSRSHFDHGNGRHEDWLLAKEPAKWAAYPLSDDILSRTYTPRSKSNCGFRRLRDRLERGESATIVTYGDSVTWGTACFSSTWGSETTCSWPNRVQAWLQFHFPTWKINVVNRAQRSFAPESFLDTAHEVDDADAYIIGFNIASREGMQKLLQALSGPKILLGLGRTCNTEYSDCLMHCQGDATRIVSVPTNGRQRLPAEGSDRAMGPHHLCQAWWYTQEYEDAAAIEYDVSLASYRDVYWRDRDHPISDVAFFFNGMSHPDTVGQDFLSHVVEYALWRELKYDGPPCEIKREIDQTCAGQPLSVFDPKNDSRSIKPIVAIGWRKFEDRPTKPGWIAESFDASSLLEFELVVRQSMVVTFLASYENVYPALMQVQGCPDPVEINPIWTLIASMPKSLRFSGQKSKTDHIILPCLPVEPNPSALTIRVSFRAMRGKFKILGILTC